MEKVEVSIGELVDKFSILEIKLDNITDNNKKIEVEKEYSILKEHCNHYIIHETYLYYLLKFVNYKIWNLTNKVKNNNILDCVDIIHQESIQLIKHTNSMLIDYAKIYKEIFDYNQKRFRIKNFFNIKFDSGLKEQKSYNTACCRIIIDSEETLLDKIPEINSLFLEYEFITFQVESPSIENKVRDIFQEVFPNILPADRIYGINVVKEIQIKDYTLSEEDRLVYDFIPIIYDTSGFLGDVIHELSIINEKFYETGKKGVLVINEISEKFRFGLEETHKDTYDVFMNQRYIFQYYTINNFPPLLSYINNYDVDVQSIIAAKLFCKEAIKNEKVIELYNREPYRINLSSWRTEEWYLHPMNVSFERTYGIKHWGHHKWLTVPKDATYENYIIININPNRGVSNINFKKVFNSFASKYKFLFICNRENDYEHFVSTYLDNIPVIPCHKCESFSEICSIITSCKLFIGGLSMYLTLAHASLVPHFIGIKNDCVEQQLYSNIQEIIPNSYLYIEDIARLCDNPDF
jgi:hypothetical protein